jgi:hypothetical protein
MGSMDSWAYDKQVQVNICLTGQLSLLMLIEEMELNGIICFMSNTDGGTFKVPKSKINKFREIWNWWENKTKLVLEETKFKSMYFSNVNNYIAIKTNGEIKRKGRFIKDHELWKNKSKKIVALALEEHFINNGNIEKFIKSHKNIYDFCILARANGKFKLYTEVPDNKPKLQAKLLRYFVSDNPDKQILVKAGTNSSGKKSRINFEAENELGKNYITIFNKYYESNNYNINYDYYILATYNIIDEIEGTKKRERYIKGIHQKDQIKLF